MTGPEINLSQRSIPFSEYIEVAVPRSRRLRGITGSPATQVPAVANGDYHFTPNSIHCQYNRRVCFSTSSEPVHVSSRFVLIWLPLSSPPVVGMWALIEGCFAN
mmetsp:Transcript_20504/g.44275  ORF Transcript_20504/g.44275 Transcript_20504/m.44275 type:complete len:104 (-) Transcript_20504:42-353(-)